MNELVKINDKNQVTTDSLTVADRFGKRHCDVLRSIKLLKCSKEFGLRNFALTSYINEQGKEQPYYDMTRDGWMFLVMGFTGAKAAEWKEKFIAAFNQMEATIKQNLTVPAPVDMKAIGGLVKRCAAVAIRDEVGKVLQGEVKGIIREELKEHKIGIEGIDTILETEKRKAIEARKFSYQLTQGEKEIVDRLRREEEAIPLRYLLPLAIWNCAERIDNNGSKKVTKNRKNQ